MNRPKPLYVRVMGDSWTHMAEPLRCMHATDSITRAYGHLHIGHGRHHIARLLARILGLPRPHAAAETRLTITARAGREHWERTFNGRRVETWQYESAACDLAERFGVLEFRYRLDPSGGGLVYVQREAAVLCWRFRMRIPTAWAPRVNAREDPAGPKRVQIDVRVVLPGVGPLISYAGLIEIEDTQP